MKLLAAAIIGALLIAVYLAINFVHAIEDCMLTTNVRECIWLTRK